MTNEEREVTKDWQTGKDFVSEWLQDRNRDPAVVACIVEAGLSGKWLNGERKLLNDKDKKIRMC